jgi:hypothetical protein
MANKNSWMRRALLKLGKRTAKSPMTRIGELAGRPMRAAVSGVKKTADRDKRVRNMMRIGGLSGSVMGRKNYNTAFRRINRYVKSHDMTGANNYIQDQGRKIRGE